MRQLMLFTSFFCIALNFALLPLRAEKVDAAKAGIVAQRYVQSTGRLPAGDMVRLKHSVTQKLRMNLTATGKDAVPAQAQDTVFYYVFSVNETAGGGFVIVSGDDAVTPVLGYSDSGRYDENNLSPNFVYWMNYLQDEIRWAISQKLPQSEVVRQQWDYYLKGMIPEAAGVLLISTSWGQGSPYNDLCPIYEGNARSVSGCVATAMAQIMNYHRHPAQGSGQSTAYTTKKNKINMPSVSFAVHYDWENMLNSYTGASTSQQKEAVATLMYHCGLSVKMDYGKSSGAYPGNAACAMATYFGYDKSIQMRYRQYHDNASWENILREQIDAGLPVLYSGFDPSGGHAFVCDGYRDDGTFHFNWGWNGSEDGYFVTSALNTTYYRFNDGQDIVINIKPDEGGVSTGYAVGMRKFSVSPASVLPGEQFTVSVEIHNAGHLTIPAGDYGAVLVNDQEEVVETFIFDDGTELEVGYYFPLDDYSCELQTDQPGKYKLKGAFKPFGGEWATVLTASNGIDFTVLGATVPVTGVSLNKTSSTIYAGKTEQLTATVSPDNATSKNVTWSSSDTEVATVSSSGLVTGVSEGTSTITVITEDGARNATCLITVVRLSDNADLIALSVNPGTLSASFKSSITDYTVNVDNDVDLITITAEPADAEARISGNGQCSVKTGSNTFKIEVTSPNGTITKTYTVVVVRGQVTTVGDNQGEPLKTYPNPAQDEITISGLQGSGILTLFDAAGRQLIRRQIASPQEKISVSHLPKGYYVVEVVEERNIKTKKILIE